VERRRDGSVKRLIVVGTEHFILMPHQRFAAPRCPTPSQPTDIPTLLSSFCGCIFRNNWTLYSNVGNYNARLTCMPKFQVTITELSSALVAGVNVVQSLRIRKSVSDEETLSSERQSIRIFCSSVGASSFNVW